MTSASTAKAEILQRIRNAQQLSDTPKHIDIPRDYGRTATVDGEALHEMLVDRLVDYKADVHVTTKAELGAKIVDVLRERGASTVTYAQGLDASLFEGFEGTAQADDASHDPREIAEVDAVITDSHVSCAETGTIVLQASETNGRRALSLVPDRHVCIVREETVVHRIPEMIERIDPLTPTTMISGPSATSDIELNRVEGVHGPRDLIVMVVKG